MAAIQSMVSALWEGQRVVIGREPLEDLRRLSDAKRLRCPACRAQVVLRAGPVLAPHFAHLPGSVCAHPHAEPETDAHRAGKLLLARWLADRLPDAVVTVEAPLPATGQRADLLAERVDGTRIALEYQCADLPAREWRRRHRLYRQAGVHDLWLLGADRLAFGDGLLRPGELERALLRDGAPLLFLDPLGLRLPAGSVARFRSEQEQDSPALRGMLSTRLLVKLPFPLHLLDWPRGGDESPDRAACSRPRSKAGGRPGVAEMDQATEDARLLRWLQLRHGVTEESLAGFFGVPVFGAQAFGCAPRLWQACVYYKWIHRRVGEIWWIEEVNTWARRYMPIAAPTGRLVWRALAEYQMVLSAAGLLTIPYGKGRARVQADFTTLGRIPDPQAALRVAAYRRTLARDRNRGST